MTQPRSERPRILVVQANETHRGVNLDALKNAGYRLRVVADKDAIPADLDDATGAILLDGLDEPGWKFLRLLGPESIQLGILVSTSGLPAKAIVGLLDLGVNAHVHHDVSPRELDARIRWATKRQALQPTQHAVPIDVDDSQRRVWLKGSPVDLPRREYEVLSVLVTHAGRVVPRERLMNTVWGPSFKADSRSLDVRISRLRKYLTREAGSDAPLIETVPGLGYRLVL